jgi:polyisoprenoid-binding protein YceI
MNWGAVIVGVALIAQAPALVPVGSFHVPPGESRVEFVMHDNRGGFIGATDRVEVATGVRRTDPDQYEGTVDARIDARAISTGVGLRDSQMRRDFLSTDRFPFITFKGTVSVSERAAVSAGPIKALLRGRLTIRDVTRDVEIPVDVTALADEYRASGEVTIKLSEYGIAAPKFLIFSAEDPVTIKLRIRLRHV